MKNNLSSNHYLPVPTIDSPEIVTINETRIAK